MFFFLSSSALHPPETALDCVYPVPRYMQPQRLPDCSVSPPYPPFLFVSLWGVRPISLVETVKAFGPYVFQLHTVQRLRGAEERVYTKWSGENASCLLVSVCPLREAVQVKHRRLFLFSACGLLWFSLPWDYRAWTERKQPCCGDSRWRSGRG